MGEEAKMSDQYETNGGDDDNNNGDEERVTEWERGLPSVDDLTPLSQTLIPPELASAFSIAPESCRTSLDVNRASQSTFSTLRGRGGGGGGLNNFKSFNEDRATTTITDPMAVEEEEEEEVEEENNEAEREGAGSESRKLRKVESEEADSALRTENSAAAKTLKRPRLVWTPQLHKRFVDVVAHLGTKSAVPKTIMQLMNVEGLTRENVASHLQKYRLYLKRMQGLSNEGPSSSDHLFASTPVPQNLHESSGAGGAGGGGSGNTNGGGGGWGGGGGANANEHMGVPNPVPYHPGIGTMMPMPVYGHMGMQMGNYHHHHLPHHQPNGFDGNVPYNMLQQRDWNGNNYGLVMSYPHHHHPHHVVPNDNM